MKYSKKMIPEVLLLTVLPLVAQASRAKPKEARTPPPKAANLAASDRGQRVFEQNCSRCHNAPEGFSTSISGTIAMHMRARANLSEADYKALRRFLNP
jgi:mono/diheme cytochrome c family protein